MRKNRYRRRLQCLGFNKFECLSDVPLMNLLRFIKYGMVLVNLKILVKCVLVLSRSVFFGFKFCIELKKIMWGFAMGLIGLPSILAYSEWLF